MDPIATARYGLLAASQSFEAAATQVVRSGYDDTSNAVSGLVGLTQARQAYAANLSVIRFAQDMWDSLLRLQTR